MKDLLGDRIKNEFEDKTRFYLPKKNYCILRIDGRAFHTYVKKVQCEKPFDSFLMDNMIETTKFICSEVQGAIFGYTQSDEISILFSDLQNENSQLWFKGNIEKICSIAGSLATGKFLQMRFKKNIDEPLVQFDARTFSISDNPENVFDYFLWRQKDAERNSISSVARFLYSHKNLEKKSSRDKLKMIIDKNQDWDSYSQNEKYGCFIERQKILKPVVLNEKTDLNFIERNVWTSIDCPIFQENKQLMIDKISQK